MFNSMNLLTVLVYSTLLNSININLETSNEKSIQSFAIYWNSSLV